jgi:hypothetical protein
VSHTKDTTEQKVRKALEHTPSPKEHFVELPVDVNSPPPDIEEAFRSGNMGMIARLL